MCRKFYYLNNLSYRQKLGGEVDKKLEQCSYVRSSYLNGEGLSVSEYATIQDGIEQADKSALNTNLNDVKRANGTDTLTYEQLDKRRIGSNTEYTALDGEQHRRGFFGVSSKTKNVAVVARSMDRSSGYELSNDIVSDQMPDNDTNKSDDRHYVMLEGDRADYPCSDDNCITKNTENNNAKVKNSTNATSCNTRVSVVDNLGHDIEDYQYFIAEKSKANSDSGMANEMSKDSHDTETPSTDLLSDTTNVYNFAKQLSTATPNMDEEDPNNHTEEREYFILEKEELDTAAKETIVSDEQNRRIDEPATETSHVYDTTCVTKLPIKDNTYAHFVELDDTYNTATYSADRSTRDVDTYAHLKDRDEV